MQAEKRATQDAGYSQRVVRHMTGLHIAAQFGWVDVIKQLLASGHVPAPKDIRNWTPLWLAAKGDHTEAMRELSIRDRTTIRLMVNATEKSLLWTLVRATGQTFRDFRNRTLLHIAVDRDDQETIEVAIAARAFLNAKDKEGLTALELAVQLWNLPIVTKLLESGADTIGIALIDWCNLCDKKSDIVEIREDTSCRKSVHFPPGHEVRRAASRPNPDQRRIL